MEKFDIWLYHSAMNSSELPYLYRIFIVFQHKKLTFNSFWGYLYLGTNCLLMISFYQGRWVITSKIRTTRQKSEWVNENPYATWSPSFCPYTSWKSKQQGLNPSSWDPWVLESECWMQNSIVWHYSTWETQCHLLTLIVTNCIWHTKTHCDIPTLFNTTRHIHCDKTHCHRIYVTYQGSQWHADIYGILRLVVTGYIWHTKTCCDRMTLIMAHRDNN